MVRYSAKKYAENIIGSNHENAFRDCILSASKEDVINDWAKKTFDNNEISYREAKRRSEQEYKYLYKFLFN